MAVPIASTKQPSSINSKNIQNDNPLSDSSSKFDLYDTVDLISFIGLFSCSFFNRFLYVSVPLDSVFDEVHFGTFINNYLNQTYFFDIVPPLSKLLYFFVAQLLGYDGSFPFLSIGQSYKDGRFPIVLFRASSLVFGFLIVPLSFVILRKLGVSPLFSVVSCVILLFDNSLIVSSKYMLADAPFLCLVTMTSMPKHFFYSSNLPKLILNIGLSSIFAGLSASTKILGFSTIFYLSCSVVHFGFKGAIRLALLTWLISLSVYLLIHYIHLSLLTKNGPGSVWMSSRFKSSLLPSDFNVSLPITYDEPVRICSFSKSTPVCLTGDGRSYPQIHTDGKVSSSGLAVFGIGVYEVPNNHSIWVLKQISHDSSNDSAYVMIYHPETDSYLITHDVASPLTLINMEVSLSKNESNPAVVWKLVKRSFSNSKLDIFGLVNNHTGTMLIDFERNLPEWGSFQREISSSRSAISDSGPSKSSWCLFNINYHQKNTKPKSVPFWYKFIEHQILFFKFNFLLDGNHPAISSPFSWPQHPPLNKGVSFWDDINTNRLVYLVGNPVGWILCLLALIASFTIFVISHRTFRDNVLFLPFTAWVFHYFPYLITRTRLLYLHYYLPAFSFSALVFGGVLQYTFGRQPYRKVTIFICALLMAMIYYGYLKIFPLSHGIHPLTNEMLESLSGSTAHPIALLFENIDH